MKLRTIAILGALGVAAIALIGAGAAATFTSNTTSQQQITAGTMNVVLSATGAKAGNNTPNLTLADVGPVGSTFSTTPTLVTITNKGNIPVTEVTLKLTDTNNNSTLRSEVWACFYSDAEVLFNEPLTTVEGYGAAQVAGNIAPGATDTYTVIFYAGQVDNGCGAAFTGFSSGAYTTYESYSGSAPVLGSNSGAASLTNPAEGGVITPMLTLGYQG